MSVALNQTTLSAALKIESTVIQVASATNITAPVNNTPMKIYVIPLGGQRGELMTVVSVSGTNVTVSRLDEFKMNFPSGSIVLIGGTDPTIEYFHEYDPVGCAGSSGAAAQVTPYVNVVNGNIWVVGLLAGPTGSQNQWVPGWNMPGAHFGGQPAAAVASVAGQITPTGPIFHVTGALAITGIILPVGYAGGSITIIPDGTFTWTTANNIALSGTAVVSKMIVFTYDFNTSKWYQLQSS